MLDTEHIRILVVDDEEKTCANLKRFLRGQGFEVESAQDVETALARIESFHPVCVLLDIRMPDLNGIEGLKMIRRRFPYIEVIMVAATVHPNVEQGCIDLGARAFVSKPVDMLDLVATINDIFKPRPVKSAG